MPPKRRTPAKAATAKAAPPAPPPPPSKPISSTKLASASASAPTPIPPPPPPPIGSPSSRVRKEWARFCDGWYEPHKNKLVEKLQKELIVKYKSLGTAKETQPLRDTELCHRLSSIAKQLSKPARTEWERRLEVAQLREDQWDDMTGEEQQAVMSVFVDLFSEDVEDIEDDDDLSGEPSSIEEEESFVEESQHRGHPSFPPPATSKLPIPPSPIRGNFEFVNPTAFFADTLTSPHSTKNLPALSMDNLATLGQSVVGRPSELASTSVGGTFSFQNWASEVGIIAQQPQAHPAKPPVSSASAAVSQTLGARTRATDNMSRQASGASTFPSPPLKTSSPQYSPPNQTTKFSPPTNTDSLPLGKRYIGPIITEEEPDPMDEKILRSKMAAEYQEYKISLRIQMIYQFHAEAAQIEIKLVEMLMADEGTKESRARAVQGHEASMMRLREQKEEERKRLCAEEREKRREELRSHVAQLRSAQNRDVDPRAKQNPPKPLPDKSSAQQRAGHGIHQKENVPLAPPVSASSSMLEAPSIQKSISTLSQDELSANEALFAQAMATMNQSKIGTAGLTPAQASSNEALFADAAAMLSAQRKPGSNGKNTLQPPSILKKHNSSRSQESDAPQITVSFAEAPPPSPSPSPEPVQPPSTIKGRKGKKGQPVAQPLPVTPVTIAEETEMDAEPPPPLAPSLWGTAANAARSAWGAASAPIPTSIAKQSVFVTAELDSDSPSMMAQAPSWGNMSTKKTIPASKKGKKVTITEEPDAEADAIVSPPPPFSKPPTATKGGWGSVTGKSKATPPVTVDIEPDLPLPTPPVPSALGKKAAQTISKSSSKPQRKVAISEEQESEFEPAPAPTSTNKGTAKTARGVPIIATPRPSVSNKQAGRKAATPQPDSHRGAAISSSKYARVDPEDEWPESDARGSGMPGGLQLGDAEQEEAAVDEEEVDASEWFKPENLNYWANFMAGQSEEKTQVAPEVPAESDKHAVWTPTVGNDSDDDGDMEGVDDEIAGSMWFEYAISGNDLPSLGVPDEPQAMPSDKAQHATSLWEQGKGKKKSTQVNGDTGNRAQQTSVFDRAAFSGGEWPKMESWLSPGSRVGQSSGPGSTRVF